MRELGLYRKQVDALARRAAGRMQRAPQITQSQVELLQIAGAIAELPVDINDLFSATDSALEVHFMVDMSRVDGGRPML